MLQPETVWQFLSPVARNFVVLLHDSVSSKQYDDNYLLEKIERLTETERGLAIIYMQSLVAQRAAGKEPGDKREEVFEQGQSAKATRRILDEPATISTAAETVVRLAAAYSSNGDLALGLRSLTEFIALSKEEAWAVFSRIVAAWRNDNQTWSKRGEDT